MELFYFFVFKMKPNFDFFVFEIKINCLFFNFKIIYLCLMLQMVYSVEWIGVV